MLATSLAVGHIEVLALLDGVGELSGRIADDFPDMPGEALDAFRDRHPGLYGEGGGWRLHVRAWLVRHPGGVVLVDTGVGQAQAPGPGWFGRSGRLLDALAETGTPPDAVDTVVLTHVHDDHIGGTVLFDDEDVPAPAFPRARYLLQRSDREWQAELAADEEEDRVIESLLLQPLERDGLLTLLDGDHEIAEGIVLHRAPGHTPGHQIVRIRSRGARALITADVFNHPLQMPHPDWASSTDAVPAKAAATRRSVLAELLSNPGTSIAPTHFSEPFGHLGTDADGLASWSPI